MKIKIHATPENHKTILDLLETQGVSLPCNCHGANCCGGRQYSFPCHMIPKEDMTISLPAKKPFQGLSLDMPESRNFPPDTILIDLGTTTVAMIFYDSARKTVFHSEVFPNPQISFGADVISRIRYDMEFPENHTLKTIICDEISKRYEKVLASHDGMQIERCFIGGNTTMIHLLLGLPLDGMSAAPFTPFPLCDDRLQFMQDNTELFILPWLSAFIGGDILSGLLYLHFDSRMDTCLLADLGTNGELVLLHHGKIYMAGTAAGPAFEGAGLSCGCPAIPGAISDVWLNKIMPRLQTIGNKLPAGICGSGAVSILSQLITTGKIDASGILSEDVPSEGLFISKSISAENIVFTREDIRQMLLAVAAIGAGIDTLCHAAGISSEQIDSLFLAGGLGYSMNLEKASVTGIFSGIPLSRIHSVGNSCLHGLVSVCESIHTLPERTNQIRSISNEIILADNRFFEKQFIRHMTYE